MDIVVGILMLCSVELSVMGNKLFVKDVETRVHHITNKKFALIEYNFEKHKSLRYLSIDDGPDYDIQALGNLRDKNYANCREMSNEQKIKK